MALRVTTAFLLVALAAGCLAGSPGGAPTTTGTATTTTQPAPAVSVADVTVAAGDTVTVTVEARNVTRLRLGLADLENGSVLDVSGANVRPRPDSVAESYPPTWLWKERQASVTVEVLASPSAAVPAGDYAFSVTAGDGITTVTERFVVTVTELDADTTDDASAVVPAA